ncbi:MAG: dTMP kinase [Ignavibacteria bacterium GWB2_35_6b]|nr:MAG: dTMP kinase [Ignavibacteria bacterium GWB2_35_6b]
MFITFEGLDFCGKSTQVKLLVKYLEEKNKAVKVIREPGGTDISEQVRKILLEKKNSNMFDETELLLFSSSRSQLVREVIIPDLQKGIYLISDRFHDSTTAYQAYGRNLNKEFIKSLNSFVIENALPDITFFIDIPLDEVEKRKAKIKKNDLDRIEISERKFYENVRDGYLKLASEEKRFRVINGLLSIEEIHGEILKELSVYEERLIKNV